MPFSYIENIRVDNSHHCSIDQPLKRKLKNIFIQGLILHHIALIYSYIHFYPTGKDKMSKLYDLQELVEDIGLPERTVRYYLAKVLEAPGGTRGRKAFYTQETLDQLKLAKQILMRTYNPKLGEVKPSLRDFQLWLKSQSAEEIHSMAEMPYRIKPKMLMAAAAPQVSQVRNLEAHSMSVDVMHSKKLSIDKEDSENTRDSAARYLERVMGSKQTKTPEPQHRRQRQQQWESFRFGDNLNIRVRTPLTPAQERQLELAGQLLQSMLEKEQT
jgi:hypothetical protein